MPRALTTVPAAWAVAMASAGRAAASLVAGLALLLPVLATEPGALLGGALLGGAVTVLVAALAVRLLLGRRTPPPPAAPGRSAAIRLRAHRAGVPRHRDPDAAGRPRPRAPAPIPLAA